MKEHPIIFSGPMVRSILDGRKTQTRRVMKPQPDGAARFCGCDRPEPYILRDGDAVPYGRCPYGIRGDRLWVRETFCLPDPTDRRTVCYRASGHPVTTGEPWKPSIHMPRWASRILLEVTNVRVERVQDISESDAESEGVTLDRRDFTARAGYLYRDGFTRLWDSINAKRGYPWEANPWVWVVGFKRLEKAND